MNTGCAQGQRVGIHCGFTSRTEIGSGTNPPTGECCTPAPAVLEFDPAGNLVNHWGGPGEGYTWPLINHGLAIDTKNNVWIGGAGPSDSHLLKFTRDGKFLLQVGKTGVAPPAPAPSGSGGGGDTASAGRGRAGRGGTTGGPPPLPPNNSSTEAFGGPVDISFDRNGTAAFVADGMRNRRVAVIDPNTGAIKRFWGAFGNRPDDTNSMPSRQFGTPVRCAEVTRDGLVYVCDRSNNRIQVFRTDGTFVKERAVASSTRGAGAVWDIAFSRDPQQRYIYVADGMNMKIHILDRVTLETLTSFGDGGRYPGQFYAVQNVATDSKGNLYTAESMEGKRLQKFVYKGIRPVTRPNQGVVRPRSGEQP
jgi:DNA-binding beta-propeller fold protein YncE